VGRNISFKIFICHLNVLLRFVLNFLNVLSFFLYYSGELNFLQFPRHGSTHRNFSSASPTASSVSLRSEGQSQATFCMDQYQVLSVKLRIIH
jgi:hypothetical protein